VAYLVQRQVHLSLKVEGYLVQLRHLVDCSVLPQQRHNPKLEDSLVQQQRHLNPKLAACLAQPQLHLNLKQVDYLARVPRHLSNNQGACLAPLQLPLSLRLEDFSGLRSQVQDYLGQQIPLNKRREGPTH
jgi:hypothetical protein